MPKIELYKYVITDVGWFLNWLLTVTEIVYCEY